MFVAFNYKEFGLVYIKDDHFLSLVGSLGSVGNGLFRLFWGNMMDQWSYRRIKTIILSLFIISCATINWAVRSKVIYAILVPITYGFFGGTFSIYPPQTIKILGKKMGTKLYYMTFAGYSIGAIIQYIFHKYLVENYGKNGYLYCFMAFGVLILASMTLLQLVKFDTHHSEVRQPKAPVQQ